jgi:hypothetical protein
MGNKTAKEKADELEPGEIAFDRGDWIYYTSSLSPAPLRCCVRDTVNTVDECRNEDNWKMQDPGFTLFCDIADLLGEGVRVADVVRKTKKAGAE